MVWSYTPRQLKAYVELAERRRREDVASQIVFNRLAYRGEDSEVNRQIRELQRDG